MQTFLFQSIKVIKCELIWSVEKICIVHSDFAVFSICNGFEIFIFKFLFFWNDDGSNNLWISFFGQFFFHILNHRKLLGRDLIVVETLIQGCQCVSCCQWYLSVKWHGHIKFIATGWFTEFKFGRDWRISKIINAFLLHFFLLIRLVLLNACTWSYKVLMQTSRESIFFPKGLQNLSM